MREKICGIYCIENLINGKKYVGQSSNITKRFEEHRRELNRNLHYNQYLQRSWNKYSEENFIFSILEECFKENLKEKKVFYIKKYDTMKNGYNLTLGGDGGSGYLHTEETKNKMSESRRGRKPSLKTKLGMSKRMLGNKFNLGNKHSLFSKIKMSLAGKGRSKSLQHKNNIGKSHEGIKTKNASSSFIGVTRKIYKNKKISNKEMWVAGVYTNKKYLYIGIFDKEIDAALSYDSYVISNNFSNKLNFPERYKK